MSSARASSSTSSPFPHGMGQGLLRGSRQESCPSPAPCRKGACRATGADPRVMSLRRRGALLLQEPAPLLVPDSVPGDITACPEKGTQPRPAAELLINQLDPNKQALLLRSDR